MSAHGVTDAERAPGGVPSHRTAEVQEVAAGLFAERGYSATTMAHIAAAIGVFPGSLYHHFQSKEDIAVAILQRFDQELGALGGALARSDPTLTPEARLRRLIGEVVALSARNAAAVRLRVFEPPTVATDRFERARTVGVPALTKTWRLCVEALVGESRERSRNAGLLRFALQSLTLDAGAHFPGRPEPDSLAEIISEIISEMLLHGVATNCPPDAELDHSPALAAAADAVAAWPRAPAGTTSPDSRARILAAARSEFARRGYDATTIRDIAQAAEVRMATLYRRVDSKEAILAEVVEEYARSIDTATRAALTTGDSAVESIDALALVFVHGRRRFREDSDIVRLGRSGGGDIESLSRYARASRERLAILEEVLAGGMAAGSIRPFAQPRSLAPYLRYALWVPYQDFGRAAVPRAHSFLRATLLRGFLSG